MSIPVTHRDHVSSVPFITGHEDPTRDGSAVDWDAFAATGGMLVVLMGVGELPLYTAELREAGLAGDTPVALIERATWPDMRAATGTLGTIADVRDKINIEPPAIIVIDEVAATRNRVKGFLQGGGADAIEMDTDTNPTSRDARGDE